MEKRKLLEGIGVDISFALENMEREKGLKLTEAAMGESGERHRLILETLVHGVQENDCDSKITYSNIDWNYQRDSTGNLKGFISVITDITKRKQTEEALRNAEARYHLLFEQSPNGIPLIDIETGQTIEVNEAAYKQLATRAMNAPL